MNSKRKRPNQLVNLLINLVIPVVILTKLSGEQYLGTTWGLVVALLFPIGYGIWDWSKEKKINIFSALGLISVLLTGGIGLFELPTQWVAIKEAGVPALLGLILLISIWTKHPLMKGMLGMMVDMERIEEALEEKDERGKGKGMGDDVRAKMEKLYKMVTYWMVVSFAISSVLNYILAKMIVMSPAGTEAFNQEIGKMTGLSYPVIVVPLTIMLMIVMIYTLKKIQKMSGLELEDMLMK